MSGGSGRRFWPLSRQAHPKQLVELRGGKSLLELTLERLLPVFGPKAIWVLTQARQAEATRRAASRFGSVRVIAEPVGKNTAPCIAYAASLAKAEFGEATMAFLPADHLIKKRAEFARLLRAGLDFVEQRGMLLTLGIKPTRPATGFGYIKRGARVPAAKNLGIYKVARFTEKPSLGTARKYVSSGAYLWNAGIFLFTASAVLEEIERYLPAIGREFKALASFPRGRDAKRRLARCYSMVDPVSIDFGVMEKTARACVLPADIGWDDLGSWESFAAYMTKDRAGNSVHGSHVGIDSRNCVVYADSGLVATIGLEGIVVVATDDAVLVAARSEAEKVKRLTDLIEEKGLTDLL
jgi:mannose-1-phosphate guanylyltransferase